MSLASFERSAHGPKRRSSRIAGALALGGALQFTAALALGGCASPDGAAHGAREADRWLGTDRAATFREHVQHVASIAVSPEPGLARLGTSWGRELEEVERRYLSASSHDDAYYAVLTLVNSLHDGHAYVVADALRPGGPAVSLPLSLRVEYEDGEARYVVREGSLAPAGSAVVAVDDMPIGTCELAHRPFFAEGNSPEALREDLARWIVRRDPAREPAPKPGEATRLRLRREGGIEEVMTLTWREATRAEPRCPPFADVCTPNADGDYAEPPVFEGLGACVYRTDDPSTRVVRYHTLLTPETRDPSERACLAKKLPRLSYALTLDEADDAGPRGLLQRDQGELLDHLARAGVSRVLFDVRENRGGDFDPIFFGAFTAGRYAQPLKSFVYGTHFRSAPERIGSANVYVALLSGEPIAEGAERIEAFLRENPSSDRSPPLPFYCRTRACAPGEATLTSQSNVVFRAAVLTGPRCFSACDDFVAMLRDNGIARTIGLPTGAGDAPYSFDTALPLRDGSRVSVHLTVGVSYRPGSTTVTIEANPPPLDVPLPPSAINRGGYLAAAIARAPW